MSSAFSYYRRLGGRTVEPKHQEIAASATKVVIWTPLSSMRIALTNLNISSNVGGTIRFFFGGNNNNQKVGQFYMGSSAFIAPMIDSWESTAIDAPLYADVSNVSTGGPWFVTAEGFELE